MKGKMESQQLLLDFESIKRRGQEGGTSLLEPPALDSNSSSGQLIEHLGSDFYSPEFMDSLFSELFAEKPANFETVTTVIENQRKNPRGESLSELGRLDGLFKGPKPAASLCAPLITKIETDLKTNINLPNARLHLDDLKQEIRVSEILYDCDARHESLDSTAPELFECNEVTQFGLTTSKTLLKVFLQQIVLQFHQRFSSLKLLWTILHDKLALYRSLVFKQPIVQAQLAHDEAKREAEVERLQKLVRDIAEVWTCIKNYRKLFGLESPDDLPKRLLIHKFTNKEGLSDFIIDLVDLEAPNSSANLPLRDATQKSGRGLSFAVDLIFKLFVDERLVYTSNPVSLLGEKGLGVELNIILARRPQILRFEFYQKKLFWRLVDSVQMFVPYKNAFSKQLLTESRKEVQFRKLRSFGEIEIARKQFEQKVAQRALKEENNPNKPAVLASEPQGPMDQFILDKIELEYSGKLDLVLSVSCYNATRGDFLATTKALSNKCRKLENQPTQTLPDINDPRVAHHLETPEDAEISKLKNLDRVYRFSRAESIREIVLRFNKGSSVKISVPLSHRDFITQSNLLSELEQQMQAAKARREQQLVHEDLPVGTPQVDSYMAEYLSADPLRAREKMTEAICELELRNRALKSRARIQLKDIISEFTFEDDQFSFFEAFAEFFQQKRKFKPVIKKAKPVSISQNKDFTIVLNIFQGSNFPLRAFQSSAQAMANSQMQGSKYLMSHKLNSTLFNKIAPKSVSGAQNNVFLKIATNFNKVACINESDGVSGSDPSWNFHTEDSINIDSFTAHSHAAVSEALGDIRISLFDDVCTMENKVISRKMVLLLEKRFLGSLKLPVIDILRNGGISGSFRISRPLIIFGYVQPMPLSRLQPQVMPQAQANENFNQNASQFSAFIQQHAFKRESEDPQPLGRPAELETDMFSEIVNPFTHMNLSLRVTIDPFIKFEPEFWEPSSDWTLLDDIESSGKLVLGADFNYLERIKTFLKLLKGRRVENRCRLLFETSAGEVCVLSRLLDSSASREILAPQFDALDGHGFKRLAYFVSLIPSAEPERARSSLILTAQEIIDSRQALNIERAFFLANCFIALSNVLRPKETAEVWVLIGLDALGRKTACVLRRLHGIFELWNCDTAESISFKQVSLRGQPEHKALRTFQRPKWQETRSSRQP